MSVKARSTLFVKPRLRSGGRGELESCTDGYMPISIKFVKHIVVYGHAGHPVRPYFDLFWNPCENQTVNIHAWDNKYC
jgi:hypothetical protein